jgi:chromatin remodeling complex protein RSC6
MKGLVRMKRNLLQAKFGTGRDAALSEPMEPDSALAAVIGSNPLPRSELIKKLWDYIREHGLQDQQKKMLINADENLRPVFGGRLQVTVFELMKLMSAHLRPQAE